jgi:hypothetical protein
LLCILFFLSRFLFVSVSFPLHSSWNALSAQTSAQTKALAPPNPWRRNRINRTVTLANMLFCGQGVEPPEHRPPA